MRLKTGKNLIPHAVFKFAPSRPLDLPASLQIRDGLTPTGNELAARHVRDLIRFRAMRNPDLSRN